MPPKKDKKAKAPPKQVIIGDYNLSEMPVLELQGLVHRLQEEVEKHRDALTFHEVEKNRIEEMWEVTEKELEEKSAEVERKCKQIEDLSREFENKGVERSQRLKFMEYARNRKFRDLAVVSEEVHKEAKEELLEEKLQNFRQLQERQEKLEELQESYETEIKSLDVKCHQYVQDMVLHRESKLKETIESYDNMYQELKNNLHLLKDVETHEYEEQKRKEYREYIQRQTKSLTEMKEYFKGITGGSLALIDVIKNEIASLKENENVMKQSRKKIVEQNEQLRPIIKEVRTCKISLAHFEQDKKSDEFTRKRINEYTNKKKAMIDQNQKLQKSFEETSEKMNYLKVNFVAKLRDIEERLRTKNTILQQKVDSLVAVLSEAGVPMSSLELETIDFAECYAPIFKEKDSNV